MKKLLLILMILTAGIFVMNVDAQSTKNSRQDSISQKTRSKAAQDSIAKRNADRKASETPVNRKREHKKNTNE